jgi:hypothetical protein
MGRGNISEPEKLEHRMIDMLSYDIQFVIYCNRVNIYIITYLLTYSMEQSPS